MVIDSGFHPRKGKMEIEKLYEDKNGYIYQFEDGYKVHWKNEKLKPDVDIKFSKHWEAYYYLCSVF